MAVSLVLRPARPLVTGRAAFGLLVSVVVALLASSSAPTPLYALYQARWHYAPVVTTMIFGVYALAVLAALLVVGSLSDYVGRRRVLLVVVAAQALTMIVFAAADGVGALLVARLLQGLWTGAALGAIGAGLVDLHPDRGTLANAVGPIAGTAVGGVLAGLLVGFLPWPTHLVYLAFAVLFAGQTVGLALMAEPSEPRCGAWVQALRPRLAVPAAARRPVLAAAPALVAAWSLGGFFASLGPVLSRQVVGSTSALVGALPLFVLAGSGAVAVAVGRGLRPQTQLRAGSAAIAVGVVLTVLTAAGGWPVPFFAALALAGSGFGSAYQGSVRTVLPLAGPTERAGLLSVVFVISYLALGLPAVIAGVLLSRQGDVVATAAELGAAVLVLAVTATAVARR